MKPGTEKLIELITAAIQFKYKSDPSTPGLLISKLKNGSFYTSILRFQKPFGKEKKVAFKTTSANLDLALEDLAKQVIQDQNHEPMDPLQALKWAIINHDDGIQEEEEFFPEPSSDPDDIFLKERLNQ